MARYAVVDAAGLVVNAVVWDGVEPWEPPDGTTAVEDPADMVGPGWTYAGGEFTPPPEPPPQQMAPMGPQLKDIIAVLTEAQKQQLDAIMQAK